MLLTKKNSSEHEEFQADVLQGLSANPKYIPSKYFYDAKGCQLFNKITHHRDYYLTNCEIEVLNNYKKSLAELFGIEKFNLIELGPGEGIKPELLIRQFLQESLDFIYIPIDISAEYLQKISQDFSKKIPNLKISTIKAEFLKGLKKLALTSERRNVVMFLGSSIGNFEWETAKIFLKEVSQNLHPGDYLFIGFDLQKDKRILQRAYDDDAKLTQEFNLNLLKRLNNELDANFVIHKFKHHALYNDKIAAMQSFLVSQEDQEVKIKQLNQTFNFKANESIYVECSHKYNMSMIEELAEFAGFEIIFTLTDSKEFFADSLWSVPLNR